MYIKIELTKKERLLIDQDIKIIPIHKYEKYSIDLINFNCGKEYTHISNFLHKEALNNHLEHLSQTSLLLEDNRLIGFITKSLLTLSFKGHKNINFFHIDYLGIEENFQKQGYGSIILYNMINDIMEICKKIGFRGISLVADDNNIKFYKNFFSKLEISFSLTLECCDDYNPHVDGNLYIIDLKGITWKD